MWLIVSDNPISSFTRILMDQKISTNSFCRIFLLILQLKHLIVYLGALFSIYHDYYRAVWHHTPIILYYIMLCVFVDRPLSYVSKVLRNKKELYIA